MYPEFEGGISPSESTFPYLNLALKWPDEPGPPQKVQFTSSDQARILTPGSLSVVT